jgi:hypothetical protein
MPGYSRALVFITSAGINGLKENITVNLSGAYITAVEFIPFIEKSTYRNKILVLIGSNFGSITTVEENFEMRNQAFGTQGVNATASYNISKVGGHLLDVDNHKLDQIR